MMNEGAIPSSIPSIQSDFSLGSVDFPCLKPSKVKGVSNPILNPNLNFLSCLNGSAAPAASTTIKLAYVEPTSDDVSSFAFFSAGDLQPHITSCESFVVGYFVEKRLAYGYVKEKLTSLWNTKGEFSMTIYGEQAFMFKFSQEEDRAKVLEIGSIQFGSKLFLIHPWSPFIEQNIGTISSVPIWLILRDVPLHLWNETGFSRISSLVGKPITTDTPTALKTRMAYARVCVEVDANCSYPSELPFQIDDRKYVVRAEYPWKPSYCSYCKSFGHSNAQCSSNPAPKYVKKWVPKSTNVDVVKENEKALDQVQVNTNLDEETTPMEGLNSTQETLNDDGSGHVEITSSVIAEKSIFVEDEKDEEGFERVSRKKKGSKKKREKRLQVHHLPISHVSPYSALLDLEGDETMTCIGDFSTTEVGENSAHVATHSEEESENDMELVVPAPRIHMTSTQNVEKLFQVFSNFEGSGSFEVKNSIFSELADKHQKNKKSLQEKELEKLGALPPDKDDTSNEKLGRGHRNSIKKKF